MKLASLKFILLFATLAFVMSPSVSLAKKGSVTGKAYLNPSAPSDCNFVTTKNTQKGCTHKACNTAVKNAIKSLQNAQPNGTCKANAESRGCKYNNCS